MFLFFLCDKCYKKKCRINNNKRGRTAEPGIIFKLMSIDRQDHCRPHKEDGICTKSGRSHKRVFAMPSAEHLDMVVYLQSWKHTFYSGVPGTSPSYSTFARHFLILRLCKENSQCLLSYFSIILLQRKQTKGFFL